MANFPVPNPMPVILNPATATISIAANNTASGQCSLGVGGCALIQLSGTWSGTVQIQASCDNVNWVNATSSGTVQNWGTGALIASGNITANGLYQVNAAGITYVRVITTAYTSGTVQGIVSVSPVSPPSSPSITLANTTQIVATSSISGAVMVSYSGTIGATPTAVKTSAGNIYGWQIFNSNTTPAYVQFFGVATGSVTLGTTAPVLSIGIPAGGTHGMMLGVPRASGTAWTIAATTTRSGSTAPSNTVDVNIFYA